MADSPRLRWWQDEEEQAQTAREAAERVAVASASLLPETVTAYSETTVHSEPENDTWAELEAEAARRVEQSKVEAAESLSFYTDKAAALTRYRRYRRVASPFIIGMMFMNFLLAAFLAYQISSLYQMYALDHEHLQLPIILLLTPLISLIASCVLNPRFVFWQADRIMKWQQDSVEPAVRLSPLGIHLCTPIHKNVTIPWGDIVSVKLRGPSKYRHLEVRNDKRRRFVIPTLYLPITAEALASRIAEYRSPKATENQVKS